MTKQKFYFNGTSEDVEIAMRDKINERPQNIPYFVRFDSRNPGFFILTWMSLNNQSETPVKKEIIAVRPYVRFFFIFFILFNFFLFIYILYFVRKKGIL
jgi:hypothetical protein